MNIVKILILVGILSSYGCLYNSNSNVVQLTESNFNELVTKSNELWLIEFYAPWCGHCKNLAPEWEKAANVLKGIVKVGAVDADQYKSLGGKFGIKGFPTIKWFGLKKDSPKDYESGRTANDIVRFATGKINEITNSRLSGKSDNESSKSSNKNNTNKNNNNYNKGSSNVGDKDVIVLEDSNFDTMVMDSKDMWLVEFYAPWCGHCKNLEPEWNKAATELKGKVKVAKVDSTVHNKLSSRFGIRGYPTIKIFPPGEKSDSKLESYEGGRSADQIVSYALEKLEKYGYIPEIEQLTNPIQYKNECENSGKTCVIVFLPNIYDSSANERNSYLEVVKKASTVGRGKPINFFWSQGGDNFEYEEKLGLSFGFPAVLVVNHTKKKYSIMRSSFVFDNIKTYLNRILIGRESFYDIPSVLPSIKKNQAWDGKDAKLEDLNQDL